MIFDNLAWLLVLVSDLTSVVLLFGGLPRYCLPETYRAHG